MRIVIIGAGGLAKEVFDWIESGDLFFLNKKRSERSMAWTPVEPLTTEVVFLIEATYLDHNDSYLYPKNLDTFQFLSTDSIIFAINDPSTRDRIRMKLSIIDECQIATIAHKTASISNRSKISFGTIIGAFSRINPMVEISSCVIINNFCSLGHGAQVLQNTALASHVDIHGDAIIGENVFIGAHAVVASSVLVGDQSVIGATCLVTRNVPKKTHYIARVSHII
jgi:acetyltransferase-like isoleucine patch superfamily enzyme